MTNPGNPSTPPTGVALAKEIFLDLLDMPADQRAVELERRAGNDPALRAAVSSLLEAMEKSEKFMVGPTVEADRISESDAPHPQIGPYKILQVIGEGGFGTVYMAEQETPVRRRVALKLIKLGMDSKQVIARFEAERQALAMMDHPNIAKVFDAGATEQGRPYFVMELVKGIPITEYCDKNNLSIRQRLDLFAQVCQAVQHAHQKGVIHRDIKPNNILVSGQDDPAAPGLAKIIDFGIAKATQARLTEKTLFTEFRQLVGTPEYMSPEQAEGSLDIDTRSDVYSLGVLLYELLTGTTPFDARELRSKAYGEIQRVIREVEPPRPSTRLSTMKDTLPSVAARRQVEPRRLGTTIRGDLDWIVMKALEKDRTRRYETANGLAADVQRYLANEPVLASPPGTAYRIRKFARRHKLGIGMAALVMLLIAGGLVGTTIGFVNARRERDTAIRARIEAETARQAEAEARAYETGTDKFLTDMFGSIDPTESRGKPVLVADILDRAVRRLDTEPPKHRKAEASLRILFARAYHSLGVLAPAHTQAQRAAELYQSEWGESDIRTARAFNELGLICFDYGRFDEAEVAFTKAVVIYRTVSGPDHADTINCENSLAELLIKRGRYDEADKLLAELLPRVRRVSGADSDDALAVLSVISNVRSQQGRALEAEQITREGLESARRRHGDDHPYTLTFANNLSDILRGGGRVAEAEPLQRQSLETARRVFGIDHPSTLTLMNNLALTLEAVQRYGEAEQIYLDLIERRRRVLGDDHPGVLMARSNYALVLQYTGRLQDAEAIFRDVVERSTRTVGKDDANTMSWTNNIAWVRLQRSDPAGAEAIYRDLVPRARQILGTKHPLTVSATMRYGHCLGLQDRWGDAEPLLADAFESATAVGIVSRQPGYAANYGICLTKLGKMDKAIPILLQADESLARAPRKDPATQQWVIDAMIAALDNLGRTDESKTWRDRRATLPATLPATAP